MKTLTKFIDNLSTSFSCFWDSLIGKAKRHVIYTYITEDKLTSVSVFDDNTDVEHLYALLNHTILLLKDKGVKIDYDKLCSNQ